MHPLSLATYGDEIALHRLEMIARRVSRMVNDATIDVVAVEVESTMTATAAMRAQSVDWSTPSRRRKAQRATRVHRESQDGASCFCLSTALDVVLEDNTN